MSPDATPVPLAELDESGRDLIFRTARTANSFTDEPVSDEQVAALYELVRWAPTSMNTQPLRVTLLRTPAGRDRLLPHLLPGNRTKAAAAPLVAVLWAYTDFHETMDRTFPIKPDAKQVYADAGFREAAALTNATLQAGFFIAAVRALGLAAGPMTGMDPAAIEKEFHPEGDHRVLMVVNIGRPSANAWFDRLPRLPQAEVVEEL